MSDRVALDRFPPHLWVTAVLVLLTVVYAVLQIGWVRPHLPADPAPNLARPPAAAATAAGLAEWRERYQAGPGSAPVWQTDGSRWARAHLGMIVQIVVFTAAAIALLALRSTDPTALLSVLALALSAVAGGGPLLGVEHALPLGLWRVLTVFAWMAGPLAFPIIALAIAYFPSPSPLIARRRWLIAVPFVAAAPMLVTAACTSLYLVGVDALAGAALWDAANPWAYYGSFAAALGLNVAAIFEGVYRYRFNHDANERRRIQMAVYTAVPGVCAYAVKDGVPIAAMLTGSAAPVFPWIVTAVLQALVLLPAFGLTYAIGVARVLGPRMVLRRSIQYALASRALTIVPIAAGAALAAALWRQSLHQLLTSGSIVYLLLFAGTLAAVQYRDRARQWLDERFFRQEYDTRKILIGLASRVRFETDPADLAALVTEQIDQALHPELTAMLASGVQEGGLSPVAVRPSSSAAIPPLGLDGGLVAMLRWSDEPLEIFLDDPRSPARRLPPAEIAWLQRSGAALIVPVAGQDRALVAAIVLGAKRSEEAYTTEDRELLASIAAQVGLGFDVARLRRLQTDSELSTVKVASTPRPAMMECPRCGRCEEAGAAACPLGRRGAETRTGAAHRGRQVPHRAAARPRRHGRGVSRAGSAARSARGAQGRPAGTAGRRRRAAAVHARSADRRAAPAPGHRVGLRLRHGAGRRRLPRDGAGTRRGPAARPAPGRTDRAVARVAHPLRRLRRHRRRARRGRAAPRPEA
jgi:hypothetical protein